MDDETTIPLPSDGGQIHGSPSPPPPSPPPSPRPANLPVGTVDVTDQFDISLASAMPPMRTFVTPSGVAGRQGKRAENTTYLGKLTESEAKKLVNRHFAISKLTDMQVREIINSSLGYEGSYSDFVRHAVELLVMYYIEHGLYPSDSIDFASDVMRQQHSMRLDMEREKLRLELITAIKVFDKGMELARRTNDMVYIADRLTKYKDMLDSCPSEAQRQQVRGVLLESIATRSAVQAFHKWTHSQFRLDVGEWREEWVLLSEQWSDWFDDAMSNS